jgi:NAD(P)-dependent dehydrogenase (short-subunit alcohol dehydrogenase family)
MHFKRTLAQFSLENKVSLVTGGARGLGLVMSQALVASGSDLAIVDLNRKFRRFIATDGLQKGQLMRHREGS